METTLVTLSTDGPAQTHTVLVTGGGTIPDAIVGLTAHEWHADANGLFHTKTDLKSEWAGLHHLMEKGLGASLTAIQRLEGNAEAVFENTGIAKLSAAKQAAAREDVQRELDAMGAAMTINHAAYGTSTTAKLTAETYLQLEHTIQGNATLEELGLQGHGLNKPPAIRYRGFTQDIQNNVDIKTLYVGGGLNNGKQAIADFFDDNIISHTVFPTVFQGGKLVQLNQNGAAENTLSQAVRALNDGMFNRVYTAADFSTVAPTPPTPSPTPLPNPAPAPKPAPAHTVTTLDGSRISDTITGLTPHVWVADANGLFHTKTDLNAEWHTYYAMMLAGHGDKLTAIQRLEGNAEAVFENTGISKLSAAKQAAAREDVQRELDAMAGAMKINQQTLGIDPNKPLTERTYLALEHTLQSNKVLEELALQGHGLNNPPATKYRGFTQDIQNNVDNTTKYVGGGLNNGKNAIADFFDDNIISHTPFPVVYRNGVLTQLNQNGNAENTLAQAVAALDEGMYNRTYKASDFSH